MSISIFLRQSLRTSDFLLHPNALRLKIGVLHVEICFACDLRRKTVGGPADKNPRPGACVTSIVPAVVFRYWMSSFEKWTNVSDLIAFFAASYFLVVSITWWKFFHNSRCSREPISLLCPNFQCCQNGFNVEGPEQVVRCPVSFVDDECFQKSMYGIIGVIF